MISGRFVIFSTYPKKGRGEVDLFEVKLRKPQGNCSALLVVAEGETEAREFLRQCAVEAGDITVCGAFMIRGPSRIVGSVEVHAT